MPRGVCGGGIGSPVLSCECLLVYLKDFFDSADADAGVLVPHEIVQRGISIIVRFRQGRLIELEQRFRSHGAAVY